VLKVRNRCAQHVVEQSHNFEVIAMFHGVVARSTAFA
jgi:hypothetical protein